MHKEKTHTFYIVIPVYNTEKYLPTCIESVLAQTYHNYEVILVDDGSPDQAGTICDQYALQDPRIHVIHKRNQGVLAARQTGIEYVLCQLRDKDSYFIFVDSDDSIQPDTLTIINSTILQHNCDLIVYGFQRVYGNQIYPAERGNKFSGIVTDKQALYSMVFNNHAYNSVCRKAIRCCLFEGIDLRDFFQIHYGEDLLQTVPLLKACSKAVFISDILYNYTVNPQSATQSIRLKNYKVNSTVRSYVWDFLEAENVFAITDWVKYRKYCCKLLCSELLEIANFRGSYQELSAIFEDVRNDAYYSKIITGVRHNCLIFCLVHRLDWGIILYARSRRFLGRLYRCGKKLFM